jgi:hypothetical protein
MPDNDDAVGLVARALLPFVPHHDDTTRHRCLSCRAAAQTMAEAVLSVLTANGWHPHYLSTACLHARDEHRDETERAYLHQRCQTDAKRYDGSRKVAARCKYGQEPCVCECHDETPRSNVDPSGLAMDDLTDEERAALVAYAEGGDDA